VTLETERVMKTANALGLGQRHLRVLRRKFDDIDIDGSGTIDPEEFFDAIGEKKSPLSEELFRIMCVDSASGIDFESFVSVSLVYCSYTKEDILKFCFDLFDKDDSGALDEREFVALCEAVNNGDPLFAGNFAAALKKLDLNQDGLIDFDEFKELDRHNPLLFYPAFRMQDSLQKRTLGERRWVRVLENINYHAKRREYETTHGFQPPTSFFDIYKEKLYVKLGWHSYLAHPPVDLEFIAALSRTGSKSTRTDDEDDFVGSVTTEGPPLALVAGS